MFYRKPYDGILTSKYLLVRKINILLWECGENYIKEVRFS